MIEFARALDADGALINGLVAALGSKEGSEAIDAFVAYARDQGFVVSRMEVVALRRAACGEEGNRS